MIELNQTETAYLYLAAAIPSPTEGSMQMRMKNITIDEAYTVQQFRP